MATRPLISSSTGVSSRMSRQRRRDTGPELAIRKLLHARGMRYRVAWPIPGMPRRTVDIAFTRMRVAVFIDGCFWHACPEHGTSPVANSDWWSQKLAANKARDIATDAYLEDGGWAVVRIWEHEDPTDATEGILVRIRTRAPSTEHVSENTGGSLPVSLAETLR